MRFGTQKSEAEHVEVAAATLRRDMERVWRAWKGYIIELRAEEAARTAEEAPEADLTGSGSTPRPRAKIDPALRQEFGGVLEARRRQVQARAEQEAAAAGKPAPDPEQVYTRLLDQIAAELDGRARPDGQAQVWYQGHLMVFDARALQQGTTDADYLASDGGPQPGPLQIAGVALGLLLVLAFVIRALLTWANGAPPSPPAAAAIQFGQEVVTPWSVTAAQLGSAPLAVTPVPGSYPLRLCVAAQLPPIASTLILTSAQAIRRYVVTGTDGGNAAGADALLADCTASPPRTLRSARLQETHTRRLLSAATLRRVQVRDAALDASIPAGQQEVLLEVALPDASSGVLVLPDGKPWAATRSEAMPGGTRLAYLVPAPPQGGPQAAGWELAGQEGLPALLPLTIPAPEPRAALLRRDVAVVAGTPRVVVQDGQRLLTLPLTLTLRAEAEPLALRVDDLTVRLGGSVGEARWTPPTLQAGKSVPLEVRVTLDERGTPVEVALSSWRARVSWESN